MNLLCVLSHLYLCLLSLFQCSHPHLSLLEQATLKQCVVGPNHAGFLLEVMIENITPFALMEHAGIQSLCLLFIAHQKLFSINGRFQFKPGRYYQITSDCATKYEVICFCFTFWQCRKCGLDFNRLDVLFIFKRTPPQLG